MKCQNPIYLVILSLFLVSLPTFSEAEGGISTTTLESVVSVLPVWDQFDSQGPIGQGAPKTAEGSGVAVFKGGYVATNQHVLGTAKVVRVRLNSGRVLEAEIVGRDVATDIALLRVEQDLPVLPSGPVPGLGEKVCSIGNQFGLGLSLGCGVVSAYPRSGTGFNGIEDFIQTDAAVNPGGSGGALVDRRGYLVGLVSAIFTKASDANIGVNFAVSTDLLYRVVSDLKDHGRVRWGQSGIRVGPLSLQERTDGAGAKVIVVFEDKAGQKAELSVGDIITMIDDRNIQKPSDLVAAMALNHAGDQINITYRRGKKTSKTKLILE